MIVASEKKISSIGTRLINAAKRNLKDCSRETSNETQKPFRNTAQCGNKVYPSKIKKSTSH